MSTGTAGRDQAWPLRWRGGDESSRFFPSQVNHWLPTRGSFKSCCWHGAKRSGHALVSSPIIVEIPATDKGEARKQLPIMAIDLLLLMISLSTLCGGEAGHVWGWRQQQSGNQYDSHLLLVQRAAGREAGGCLSLMNLPLRLQKGNQSVSIRAAMQPICNLPASKLPAGLREADRSAGCDPRLPLHSLASGS